MKGRTPILLITGPLGSGKTTLLRQILKRVSRRIAILMNEFGEIAIDSKVIEGKNIRIAELGGGCVCCSLQGEFEAAVKEVIEKVSPEVIVVETTGVAEPDALIFNIQDALPEVRLDGVITLADADAMIRFPRLGHTTRMQIEDADIVLLNKTDLISAESSDEVKEKIRQINETALILPTSHAQVHPDLIFGASRERDVEPSKHIHQTEFDSFSYTTANPLGRNAFEEFVDSLGQKVYRAKGFVRFPEGTYLFNYVAGRWEMEPFPGEETVLIFIGEGLQPEKEKILSDLKRCELETSHAL